MRNGNTTAPGPRIERCHGRRHSRSVAASALRGERHCRTTAERVVRPLHRKDGARLGTPHSAARRGEPDRLCVAGRQHARVRALLLARSSYLQSCCRECPFALRNSGTVLSSLGGGQRSRQQLATDPRKLSTRRAGSTASPRPSSDPGAPPCGVNVGCLLALDRSCGRRTAADRPRSLMPAGIAASLSLGRCSQEYF